MSKEILGIIKDLIISILIVIAIVLVIVVIFYDKIAIATVIPTVEKYTLTEEMQEDINESYIEEAKQVITTYSIDAAELKGYEKTKEYDKGKKNPFAVESDSPVTDDNTTNSSKSSNSSQNFYDDDGTK